MVAVAVVVVGGAACGIDLAPREAWQMTFSTEKDCSFVGVGAGQCADATQLAQTTTHGRWVFEHGSDDAFTVNLDDGRTLAGIDFQDDGRTLQPPTAPCLGQGGICYFARDRSASVDPNDNNCARIAEFLMIARLVDDNGTRKLTASLSDRSFRDEACGTPSGQERVVNGVGVFQADPAAAQSEVRGAN